jgi:hypothetical protein
MHIVSFNIKKMLNITIHNLYPSLELTYPVYCSNGTTCHVSPHRKTDIGIIMKTSFGIDSRQKVCKGALLYKLERKRATRTDNHLNSSTTVINNIVKNVCLLVVWGITSNYHKHFVRLIEFTDNFTWDEDKLWALCRDYHDQFYVNYKSSISTWLMHNGEVMKTRLDATYGLDCKLDITISEGVGNYNMKRLIEIDSKRLVLLS